METEALRVTMLGNWKCNRHGKNLRLSLYENGQARLLINGQTYPMMGWLKVGGRIRIGEYFIKSCEPGKLVVGMLDHNHQEIDAFVFEPWI